MERSNEKNVLQRLLCLEAEAAALIKDANAEANHRLSDEEKICRAYFEKAYSAETASLEALYINEIKAIKEEYKKQLEAYRESLASSSVDKAAFFILAEQFFLEEA
jgi:hypothetical protein